MKCFYQDTCPYYESTTSYGREIIECGNTDCPKLKKGDNNNAESEDKE